MSRRDELWIACKSEAGRVGIAATATITAVAAIILVAFKIGGVTGPTILSIFAAVCFLSYIAVSYGYYTEWADPQAADDLEEVLDGICLEAQQRCGTITKQQVLEFYRFLVDPQMYVRRLNEMVEHNNTSLSVLSEYHLRHPEFSDASLTIPIHLLLHQSLQDNITVKVDGTAVSPLSHREVIVHGTAIYNALLSTDAGCTAPFLKEFATAIYGSREWSDDKQRALTELEARISSSNAPDVLLKMASSLLRQLSTSYPLCIELDPASSSVAKPAPTHHIVSIQTYTYNRPVRKSRPTRASNSYLRHLVVRAGKQGVPRWVLRLCLYPIAQHAFLSPWYGFYIARTIRDWLRSILGIPSSIFYFPLANSWRARSYHLQVTGRAGTYLARQGLADLLGEQLDTNDVVPYYATAIDMRPRVGQRHAHLYARSGNTLLSSILYETRFYERLPGSTVGPLISSLVSMFAVQLCAAVQLGIADDPQHGSLLVLALTVPAAIGTWAGFSSTGPGRLITRLSTVATIIINVIAAGLFLVLPKADGAKQMVDQDQFWVWTLLVGLSSVNLCVILGSFITQCLTQRKIQSRSRRLSALRDHSDQLASAEKT